MSQVAQDSVLFVLPDEMLCKVAAHLSNGDLYAIRSVSRRMLGIGNEVLSTREFAVTLGMRERFKPATHGEVLKLRRVLLLYRWPHPPTMFHENPIQITCPHGLALSLLPFLPSETRVYVLINQYEDHPTKTITDLAKHPQLHALKVNPQVQALNDAASLCTGLHTLALNRRVSCLNLPRLQSLVLESEAGLTKSACLPNLRSLELNTLYSRVADWIAPLARKVTKLKIIRTCIKLQSAPHAARHLVLRSDLAACCFNLKFFPFLVNTEYGDKADSVQIRTADYSKHFYLSVPWGIDLERRYSNLRSLVITHVSNSDDLLCRLGACCPVLLTLSVTIYGGFHGATHESYMLERMALEQIVMLHLIQLRVNGAVLVWTQKCTHGAARVMPSLEHASMRLRPCETMSASKLMLFFEGHPRLRKLCLPKQVVYRAARIAWTAKLPKINIGRL